MCSASILKLQARCHLDEDRVDLLAGVVRDLAARTHKHAELHPDAPISRSKSGTRSAQSCRCVESRFTGDGAEGSSWQLFLVTVAGERRHMATRKIPDQCFDT